MADPDCVEDVVFPETGDADQVCEHPRDEYTKKLLAADGGGAGGLQVVAAGAAAVEARCSRRDRA